MFISLFGGDEAQFSSFEDEVKLLHSHLYYSLIVLYTNKNKLQCVLNAKIKNKAIIS